MIATATTAISAVFSQSQRRLERAGFDMYQIAMIHAVAIALIGVITAFALHTPVFGAFFVCLLLLSAIGYYLARRHAELRPLQTLVSDLRVEHATQNTNLTRRIEELSGEVRTLQQTNQDLGATVESLRSQWARYQTTHAEHIATLETIFTKIGEASGRLATLTPQLDDIQQQISIEAARLSEIRSTLAEQLQLLQSLTSSLDHQVSTLPQLPALVTALEAVVRRLAPNFRA